MIIIAHNIRSLYNVGSIFRNCAAFDVEKLYLTGYTGSPPRKEISKVALGAQHIVKWEERDIFDVIEDLKKSGVKVYGLETGEDAIPIDEVRESALALVLGNEVEGIEHDVLSELDGKIKIPMGAKQSLNVAVASGVAMYALRK